MILEAEIEQYRTSDQLKSFVEEVRDRVESDPDELQRARRGEGLYKAFVNEVMPLSQFAHLLYSPETLFRPVLGNQGYDVEVFDGQRNPIDRIEIAKPHDGQAEAEDNRLVAVRGFGQTRVYDLGGQLDALAPWIADTAENKSLKDYSDCTLVIVAATDPPFDEELPVLEQRSIEIVEQLGKMAFRAKRAYLAVPSLNKCFKIEG
ncbi:hypothetical protein [Methylotuvimicrobium alcaliphilum]|uniref:Uncharacterized protein n=1 Tax=Methylotuvimicrobium alcaliphilum (strain DSM 19304 / NCIMB 14124 / VKM B-2133 / 20Z) TaxID=1091494 RepID=G4SUY3_META2|nr:hypothetical protein [Methylotuvimicrobium alcaliphilum]CCE24042.1 protein of unknown function [Methylotuvimicrobium alcaliphilum 20Z]